MSVTFQDYLDGEERSQVKHEWVAGRIYAMAGGTERHDLMCGLVFQALATAGRQRGCRPFQQNRKVKIDDRVYIPDVMLVCRGGQPPDRLYERDATVVVEVLSPSHGPHRQAGEGARLPPGCFLRGARPHRSSGPPDRGGHRRRW